MAAADVSDNRQRELMTPEGVDLHLVLAETGERATAFLIDIAIMAGLLVSVSLLVFGAAFAANLHSVEFIGAIWLIGAFILRNFYFMAFEMSPRAATPGKRVEGLRVAARNGGPLTAEAIFARNAMRELEVFLPLSFVFGAGGGVDGWIAVAGLVWSGIFLFFPFFNRDRLRVGDLVAGTWVVRAPRRVLDADLAADAPEAGIAFTAEALDAYGIKELTVLEEVLRKSDPETMKAVADRIRKKIAFVGNVPNDVFLRAYYKGLRGRLEARLLFGRRRKDKYDTA
ncbi:MAG TPA: RDD family protein [Rhizomicrobium sp.]|jgi:uncharacterized RDD family membrane protein YckC